MKTQSYKKAFNVAIATVVAAGAVVAVAPIQADAALSFSDVKETNSHYANILNLAERGVINGYEDGTFRPGESIKRGQAAKIIAGVLGLDTTNVKNPNFKDVTTKNANYGAIAALASAGIINGFENGTYRANDTLTRGQMAKIISNAFKLSSNGAELPFTDVTNSQYKENIAALFANNVTTGVTATTFDAKSSVTRGQLASFVVRAEAVGATEQGTVEESVVISSVENGQVVIGKNAFEIAEELTSVFSAENAAALKNSEVELVIEYTNETVASLTPVFAKAKGKVVGIKGLKLVNPNTVFNPKGYAIPKVGIGASGVTLQEVVTSVIEISAGSSVKLEKVEVAQLTVAAGATAEVKNSTVTSLQLAAGSSVDLVGSKVAVVEATGDAKIKVDATTTLQKVIVPKGKTLADVITNYAQVKDSLKNVVVEAKAEGTPGGPTNPGTGTGSGSGSDSGSGDGTTESIIVKKLDDSLAKLVWTYDEIALYDFDEATRTIDLTIKGTEATVGEVKTLLFGLMDSFKGIGLSTLTLSVNEIDVSNKTKLEDFSNIELLNLATALKPELKSELVDVLVNNYDNNEAIIAGSKVSGYVTLSVGSTDYKVNFQ